MDTNETPKGTHIPQEEARQAMVKKKAPAMDAVSAGGRPRRPDRPEQGKGTKSSEAPRKKRPESSAVRQPSARNTQAAGRSSQEAQRPERLENRTAVPSGNRKPPQRRPQPAQAGKKSVQKKKSGSDAGYQPYRKANAKRKAQRSVNLRNFFSSENPVLKWFEKVRYSKDTFAETSDLAKQRRQQRAEEEEKRRKRQNRFQTPAVIYTQPAAFNRDKLIVQMISLLTVVVALMMCLSLFFKVERITVAGNDVYQGWSIVEASGISKGDNLLTFSRARAASQIRANLPYVKSVRIGIKLPDTVNIEVVESDVVYAIQDDQGTWWLMNSDAKVTEMVNANVAGNYTKVLGVTLSAPKIGDTGVATELTQAQTDDAVEEDAQTMPTVQAIVVSGAQRLAAAQEILKALEENDIVGEAVSVDVSNTEDIVLWYGSRYQVNFGDITNLSYKVACMYDAVLQMSDYQTGILDVSFTIREDQVVLTPFD